jgi:hypothetical protein
MPDQFVGEVITPETETCDAASMAAGEPGLPRQFAWRGETVRVAAVVRAWRETGPCHHGSGETYVRKHWYEVVTTAGVTMKLYFERQSRGGRKGARWWLYSVAEPEAAQRAVAPGPAVHLAPRQ